MKKIKIPEEYNYKKNAEMIRSIFKNQANQKKSFWCDDVEKVVYGYYFKEQWRFSLSYYTNFRRIYKLYKDYMVIDETPFFMLIWDNEYKYLRYFIEKANGKYIRIWGLGIYRTTEKKVEYQDIIVNNEFGSTHHPFFELMSEKWVDKLLMNVILRGFIRLIPVKEGWSEGKVLKWYDWS